MGAGNMHQNSYKDEEGDVARFTQMFFEEIHKLLVMENLQEEVFRAAEEVEQEEAFGRS